MAKLNYQLVGFEFLSGALALIISRDKNLNSIAKTYQIWE